jgi:hypothetical protein
MVLIFYLVVRDHLGELSGGQTMAVIKGMFRK